MWPPTRFERGRASTDGHCLARTIAYAASHPTPGLKPANGRCVASAVPAAVAPRRNVLGFASAQAAHGRAYPCRRAIPGPLVPLKLLSPRAKTHRALDLGSCRLRWQEPLAIKAWPRTRRELANLAGQTEVLIIVTKSGNLKVLPRLTGLIHRNCDLATTVTETVVCAPPTLKIAGPTA